LATGAWDIGYSSNLVEYAHNKTVEWLVRMNTTFNDASIVFANLVVCHEEWQNKATHFNFLIAEYLDHNIYGKTKLLDREKNTVGLKNMTLCDGWHAYGNIVSAHVHEYLRILSEEKQVTGTFR